MFIVTKRSELIRFGLFLVLAGLLVWFVTGRFEAWRLAKSTTSGGVPVDASGAATGALVAPASGVGSAAAGRSGAAVTGSASTGKAGAAVGSAEGLIPGAAAVGIDGSAAGSSTGVSTGISTVAGSANAIGSTSAAAGGLTRSTIGASGLDVSEGHDYFAEFRIDRERTRGALGERLKELMESRSATEEVRKQASEQYLRLGQTVALESRAEAMVKARGYDDVIVNLAESSAQVVVKGSGLSQQQVLQVMDTVSRITGIKSTGITVLARR